MPTDVIQHLRRAVLLHDHAGLTDGQLLGCFVEQRDEDAFAALVRRHGPMVWGVCRRILTNTPDAEDAFQATFLVLVRKASSVVPREMVGNWLYGVAHHAALKARRGVARRREKQMAMPERTAAQPESADDLRPLLDEEMSRLPDKYRVVIVLCDLEGKTRAEAARRLGWPEGTVAGRLARARKMLAGRLARRGVSLTGLTGLVPTGVPGIVVSSTIQAGTSGATSAAVAVLIQGVLNAMFLTKLKTAAVVLAMLGAATLTCGMIAGKGDGPVTPAVKGEPKKATKGAKDDALRRERDKLEGAWRVVSSEVRGKKLAKGTFEGIVVFDAEGRWKQQTGDGTTLQSGTSEIDLGAKPRAIHFKVTSKGAYEGITVRKLYEFIDNDSIRTCAYTSETERPEEFPKSGTGRSLDVLERGKKLSPLSGTVEEIDDKSILLNSGERVTLDAKTDYLRETGRDPAPAERKDVTKGKLVTITTRKEEGKHIAVVVLLRLMPSSPVYPKATDAAILDRLKKLGVKGSDSVSDSTFIRRTYLDVLGVPPSPRAVEDFVNDKDADKRKRLILRLTTRLAPGIYTGACQVMQIDTKGVITYPDSPGPVIRHIELLADGGLKAEFPDKELGRGKWHILTMKLSSKEPRSVWTATMKGDTYKATAIPYSQEAHLFRLEILTDGKLVAGAQQFFAIRQVKAEKK